MSAAVTSRFSLAGVLRNAGRLIGAACLCWAATGAAGEPPPELQRALRAREGLRNGRIEWTIIDYMTTIEAQRQLQRVSTFSADVVLVECHPAVAEPVAVQSKGRSPGLLTGIPRRELYRGEEFWAYELGDTKTDLRPPLSSGDAALLSQRELGLSPWHWPLSAAEVVRGALLPGTDPLRFAVDRQGELATVTLRRGANAIRWLIDPARDWGVIRVEHFQDGALAAWSQSILERIDGVWFPRRAAFFSVELNGGEQPISEVIVQAATFKGADLPRTLSPADLGIDVGTNIDVYDARGRARGLMKWDGRGAIPLDEYNERARRGELRDGPGFVAARERMLQQQAEAGVPPAGRDERARARRPVWERFKNRWEDYADRFVAHYRLDADQAQSVERILADCLARADEYTARNRSTTREIEEREDRLHSIADADARQVAIATAREHLRMFLAPLDEIFENCLKRRLEALPTKAQRATADAPPPSSAPAAATTRRAQAP